MSWQARTAKIQVGDPVRYSPDFLASIREGSGSAMRKGRGVVTEILTPDQPYARAVIEWDDPELPQKVALSNLSKVQERGVTD